MFFIIPLKKRETHSNIASLKSLNKKSNDKDNSQQNNKIKDEDTMII